MEVCEACHSKDANVISCKRPIKNHHQIGLSVCAICGKYRVIYMCHKYSHHKKRKGEMHSEKKTCDNCKFFGECFRLFISNGDLNKAKDCVTFIPKEEKNGGGDKKRTKDR